LNIKKGEGMRLISFFHAGSKSIGAELNEEEVIDLHRANALMPNNLREFLEMGDQALELTRELLEEPLRGTILKKRDILLAAPI
jgi:hypothetical protein